MNRTHRCLLALLLVAGAVGAVAAAPFATVGGTEISAAEYQRALAVAMRKKYYHAKPPQAEYAAFQREVGDDIVNRVLLLAEAKRRGIRPDRAKIDAAIAAYDRQYDGSATWKARREQMLGAVVPQLEGDSQLEQLEALVKRVAAPDAETVRAYYERHRERFVEPEQVKLSAIVLKVDPSSPQSAWDAAKAEAQQIHRRLIGGADFAALARSHSGDRSAANGGAMDYTHRGMLPQAVHAIVDALKPREISAPVQLLEGVAILRLDDRRAAQPRRFEDVRARAAALWARDEGEARWRQLIAELRRATPIRIDESHYAPLRTATPKAAAG